MTNLRTLMLGAALVGFAALPAAALNIATGESSMLTVVPAAPAGDSTATTTTTATDTTGTANSDVTPPENAMFAGNTVISSDGAMAGKVRGVTKNADGTFMMFIDVDPALGTKAQAFTINVMGDAQADGSLLLGWSKAELVAALDAQVK